MRFSKLTEAAAREMLEAAADPSYREMNRLEAELAERLAAHRTPDESFTELLAWLKLIEHLGADMRPNRDVQPIESFLL